MPREEIDLAMSLKQLGDRLAAAADRELDDEPMRDLDGRTMTGEQALELVRRIERDTGEQLIFRRGERRRPRA